MAKFERIGDAVLAVSEVKLARVVEGEEPELRVMLRDARGPGKLLSIRTESVSEAYTWLGELAQVTSLVRVGRALVPTSQVQRAQAVATHQVKGANDELEDAGPALRVHLQSGARGESVYLPADNLEQARGWLAELLQLMNTPPEQRQAAPAAEAEVEDPDGAPDDTATLEMPPAAEDYAEVPADAESEADTDAGWPLRESEAE